ncbi:hypothetical protein Ddye_005911 [Dipteronia dyeriana]|uniref:DUF4371 domain-containing protein n=1 Tax=Dipteronia dyeriana TaxID=168575 RepID=A0AAD9XI16_9ROSI|nr:hypothetical protein Ddye_005911 [Dipteronia dyeriana]
MKILESLLLSSHISQIAKWCVVFRPFKREILEVVVTMVNEMYPYIINRPVQIFVSNHLIPDDMEFQSAALFSILTLLHATIQSFNRIEIENVDTPSDINTPYYERDPGLRLPIEVYPVDKRDDVRKAYIKMGPCQPILDKYPPILVGNIIHNAMQRWNNLKDSSRHIDKVMNTLSVQETLQNRLRLKTSLEAVKWLAMQGCAFRGHDESINSTNRGNFIEMIKLQAKVNQEIDEVVIENSPVRAKICEEVRDAIFCILVDEAVDESNKEQMAIILRYVDYKGFVRERFFQVVSVNDTNASTLKREICNVISRYDLSIENLRGQGYNGASNMRCEWNGLQAVFLKDCPYAYYIHCFAHRLQLALVAVAKEVHDIWLFFSKLNYIVNFVSASSKRHSELKSIREVLGIFDMHCQALQLKSQDILNAMNLVSTTKMLLQKLRENEWDTFLESVVSFFMKATTERTFSAMKLVKTPLRNKMDDNFLIDCNLNQALQLLSVEPNPTQLIYELLLLSCTLQQSLFNAYTVHSHLADNGFDQDPLATNLINMFSELDSVDHVRQVFNKTCDRTIYAWNALFKSLTLAGHGDEVLDLYQIMNRTGISFDRFTYVYVLKGLRCVEFFEYTLELREGDSCTDFETWEMVVKNMVSWSVMIACYTRNEMPFEPMELFQKMMIQTCDTYPDSVTIVSVLQACATLAALKQGKLLHAYILRKGLDSILHVISAPVVMFAKCGKLELGQRVFDQMDKRGCCFVEFVDFKFWGS